MARRFLLLAVLLAGIAGVGWLVQRRATEVWDTSTSPAQLTEQSGNQVGAQGASGAGVAAQAAASRASTPAAKDADRDTIVVQVLDTHGVPRAGIEVAIAWQVAGQLRPILYRVGRTRGAEGTLAVHGVRAFVRTATAHNKTVTGQGLTVECLGETAEVVPFDAQELPREVVRLRLPPSGSVLAELVDGTEQPLLQELAMTLEILALDGAEVAASLELSTYFEPGPARFSGAALGRRLRARLQRPEVARAELKVDGPTRDGEEVGIRWQVPAGCAFLAGQVLTADGRVAAGCALAASGLVTGYGGVNERIATDRNGRFRWVAGDARAAGNPLVSLTLDEYGPQGLTGRRASARFGHTLRPGSQDLGTFTLAELPLLVAGEVVDAAGQPITEPMATVALARRVGTQLLPLCAATREAPLLQYRGPSRFEFLGHADDGELVATVTHPRYLPSAATPFTRGARDLRITLLKGHRITVRVTSPDGELLAHQDVQLGTLDRLRTIDRTSATPPFHMIENRKGVATLAFAQPSISFVVSARGHRPKVLRDVATDVVVVLDPGRSIQARLLPVALPEGMSVYGFASPTRSELDLHRYASGAHPPGETVSLGPLVPGSYDLVYVLCTAERKENLATRAIEVLDVEEPQVFTVTCTEQELAAALRALARR